jgi:hypothetical protein
MNVGVKSAVFQKMIALNNSGQYAELLGLCTEQIQNTPEWLTPRLLCALAYLATGDQETAKTDLAFFDAKTGPAYSGGACKQMADYLHQRLR